MEKWAVILSLMAVSLAGCLGEGDVDADSIEGGGGIKAQAQSTDEDVLVAVLESSHSEFNGSADVNITFDVETELDEVEWELTMKWNRDATLFHLGAGGLEDLPGSREITLQNATYTFTLTVTSGNESSSATLTVIAHPDPSTVAEVDPCGDAPVLLKVGAAGETTYTDPENGVWQESNGREGLQTPDSCPDGPHDTRIQ